MSKIYKTLGRERAQRVASHGLRELERQQDSDTDEDAQME